MGAAAETILARVRGRWKAVVALGAALAVVLALAGAYAVYRVGRAPCFALVGDIVCRVETREPVVALTFDDGPTPLGVGEVLPILDRYGVKATFFLIGGWMEANPDLAPRLLAAGHELGNHSYSHRRMWLRLPGFYADEIERTEALLTKAGSSSGLFRPPYGKKLLGLPLAVRRSGLSMIMAEVADPITDDPAVFAEQMVAVARPGSILLIHPMYPANETGRRALPLVLEGLRAKGLRVVTVGQLRAMAEPAG